jgi:hypothetical protein
MKTLAKWIVILWSGYCLIGLFLTLGKVGEKQDIINIDKVDTVIGIIINLGIWFFFWIAIAGPTFIISRVIGKKKSKQKKLSKTGATKKCEICERWYDEYFHLMCPYCFKSVDINKEQTYKISITESDSDNDIVKGYKFHAFLNIYTPLSVLIHEGETHKGPESKLPQYGSIYIDKMEEGEEEIDADPEGYGGWFPELKTYREMGVDIDEMGETDEASDAGPVMRSEYIPFLIEFRKIVEGNKDIKNKIELIKHLCKKSDRYMEFCKAIDYDFPYSFFPEYNRFKDILETSLKKQCELLGIELIKKKLKRDFDGNWILENGEKYLEPEEAAFAMLKGEGYRGSFCEGGAIFTLMHAASLDYLAEVNTFNDRIDACRRFFKAQCVIHKDKKEMILKEIDRSDEKVIRKNLKELNLLSQLGSYDEDIIINLWKAIGKNKLYRISEKYIDNPYQFSSGWPDLTLFKDNKVIFIEIKTTDKLHKSQIILIRDLFKPLNLNCKVMEIT